MNRFDELIGLNGPSKETRPCIAVAAAEHRETLSCLKRVTEQQIADVLLFGDREQILSIAESLGFSIPADRIIDVKDHVRACELAVKAVTLGTAGILMKGIVHTAVFSRAFLDRSAGLVPTGGLISHLSLFELPFYHKPLFITDSAINIDPDLPRKEKILHNALRIMHRMGLSLPKVAVIGPVETVSPKILSTVDARSLAEDHRRNGTFGESVISGPLSMDAALSSESAAVKGITDSCAGDADLLLMPNLDTANAVNKVMTLTPGSRSAGIIAGLSVPVVLTSRSDSDETRFYSVCMALRSML
ncbi:MAG: phosphate butyryltransferase [Spirochaetia bacterium]|nr:phosphate butyryltransferase [Spirochaetia bacterium]